MNSNSNFSLLEISGALGNEQKEYKFSPNVWSSECCRVFVEAKRLAQLCARLATVASRTKFGTPCRARKVLCLARPLLFAEARSSLDWPLV